jgi:hypothetical protein
LNILWKSWSWWRLFTVMSCICILLILPGSDCGSNNWESFILCPRSESWKRFFIHLSRWHNKAVDVSWLPCTQGICKYFQHEVLKWC